MEENEVESRMVEGTVLPDAHSVLDRASTGEMRIEEGFGTRAISQVRDAQSAAAEARATALVQARFIIAERRPRDWLTVRQRVLRECQMPTFADKAVYAIKRGGKTIRGLSTRAAEAIQRLAGNMDVTAEIIAETPTRRDLLVQVIDLETNASWSNIVTVDKTVERRETKDGDIVLSTRENSTGQKTHLIVAREDDLWAKQQTAVSKIARNNILKLTPIDLREELMANCLAASANKAKKNLPDSIKRMTDSFAEIGVQPIDIQEYLGHPVDQATVAEIQELGGLFNAIKEGHQTWKEIVADQRKDKDDSLKAKTMPPPTPGKPQETVDPKTGEVLTPPMVSGNEAKIEADDCLRQIEQAKTRQELFPVSSRAAKLPEPFRGLVGMAYAKKVGTLK